MTRGHVLVRSPIRLVPIFMSYMKAIEHTFASDNIFTKYAFNRLFQIYNSSFKHTRGEVTVR
jgi:hypothetical protein